MCKNSQKSKFKASKCVEMADFALQESSKLISRKIWVIQKSWNFHTVIHLSGIPFWNITYPVKWRRSKQSKNVRTCNFALSTTITNIANFLRSPFSTWHLMTSFSHFLLITVILQHTYIRVYHVFLDKKFKVTSNVFNWP